MKKALKRILPILLIVAMLMSVTVIAAAEEEQSNASNAEIVFFGDSVTQAWGPNDFYFCQAVAEGLGIENSVYGKGTNDGLQKAKGYTEDILAAKRVIFGTSGVRTHEALIALDAAEFDEDDSYYQDASSEADTMAREADGNKENYIKAVAAAKTIVIETGADDTLYFAQQRTHVLDKFGELASMSTDEITGMLTDYSTYLWEGYNSFCEDMPALIERVMEIKAGQTLGKDYQIVLVSLYNPMNGLTITDEMVLPVGDLIGLITSTQNAKLKEWAKQYGVKYADISNVETGAMSGVDDTIMDFATISTYRSCMATHPSYPEGYKYIARQILAELKEEAPVLDSNIRIDLGAVESVSTVTVGLSTLKPDQYSYDPVTRILTVKYLLPNATTCTVTSVDKNGKIFLAMYGLSYKLGEGYSAHLLYSTVNLANTAAVFFRNLNTIGNAISTAIRGLFAK